MIKGINTKVELISDGFNNYTYRLQCADCGHSGFVTTPIGKFPVCPGCKEISEAGISVKEIAERCDKYSDIDDRTSSITLKEEGNLVIKRSTRVKKEAGMLNSRGYTMFESIFRAMTGEERVPLTKEEFKAKQEETNKILNAPVSKKPSTKKKSSAITDCDLVYIMDKIKENLKGKFKNKDLAPLVADKFTARQTPSRLKKLVESGHLDCDSSSPKSYWLKEN